jgi:two-component system, NtrC family, nitrogen regulation sensor histidine kinase NtrY
MVSKRTREISIAILLTGLIIFLVWLEKHLPQFQAMPSSHVMFLALLNLNIVLLILVIFLVVRNVVKLMLERRKGMLGSRLRTKLVAAFVTLTIFPAMALFFTSVVFVDRSMEGWLSEEVKKAIAESLNIANIYYQEASVDAQHYATFISEEITQRRLLREGNLDILKDLLEERMEMFRLSAVEVFSAQGEELVKIISPKLAISTLPDPESGLVKAAMDGKSTSRVIQAGKADIIEGIVPIHSSFNPKDIVGVLAADYYVPESLSGRLSLINTTYTDYIESLRLKAWIKTEFIMTLTTVTLLVIFSAIWYGLNLSKGLTNPIQKLVEGTQRVSKGDLGFSVDVTSDDELGILVRDFNEMVGDLRKSRASLEQTYNELAARNKYINTVLKNVSTGVISVDEHGDITMINASAQKMLAIKTDKVIGRNWQDVMKEEHMPIVTGLSDSLNNSKNTVIEKEIVLNIEGRRLSLLVHASLLYDDNNEYMGGVVVFDDLTELQRMQRVAAWREVARRIAHEIKNPLTPIQLSAQRLRRRYLDRINEDPEVFDECTRLIITQVEEMKLLVDEFSAFAKMPSSMPVPDNLNEVLTDAVALYKQAHSDIEYIIETDDKLPSVEIDRSQMSRAITNLLENATIALKETNVPSKTITAKISYNKDIRFARLEIMDSGPGIPQKVKERMFEPYFSTKRGGTGLGLVIVKSIISDHNGFIRVRDNKPTGTIITIELPVKEKA